MLCLDFGCVRETGWEGIGRLRCSEGLVVKRHYGNLGQLRHDVDVRFPVLDSDTAFAVEFDYDGQIDARAYVQFAYLYTTSSGSRRIRVSTVAAGVTSETGTLFRSADCEALVGFACRQACRDLPTQRVSVIRDRLTMTCVDILAAYRKHCTSNPASGTSVVATVIRRCCFMHSVAASPALWALTSSLISLEQRLPLLV